MEENTRENKMGTMPIGKLLANMAGPVMISMLFQALYNIVDSVFVARLSQDAMNAVSLAFPLQMLCIAFSVGDDLLIGCLQAEVGRGHRKAEEHEDGGGAERGKRKWLLSTKAMHGSEEQQHQKCLTKKSSTRRSGK